MTMTFESPATTVTRAAGRRAAGPRPDQQRVPIRGFRRNETTPLLRTFMVLLFGLPSGLVFGPLGAAGSPANVLAMVVFVWWFIARLTPNLGVDRGRQPIRTMIYALQVAVGLSYVAGTMRAISGDEVSSSDRAILSLFAWSGLALVAADGIRSRAALDRVLRFLVGCGVFLAGLGVVQFFSSWNPVGAIKIPGLTVHTAYGLLAERSDFPRVVGTASHPIEFGVVLSLILPIAMHYAWFAPPQRRLRRWTGVLVIGAALPMTIARSAIVGAAIVVIFLLFTVSRAHRRKLLIWLPVFAVILRLMIPGLLGTIKSLFLHIQDDPSTTGRTEDYSAVIHYVGQNPFFGRGIGTWLPQNYRVLDNAYLGWVIEAGIVGLIVLIALVGTGIGISMSVRARSKNEETRSLAASLAASLTSALITFGTFDALGFSMCAGVMFGVLGCTGALWRLHNRGGARFSAAELGRTPDNRTRIRRIGRTIAVALLIAIPAIALLPRHVGAYQASGALILQGPKSSTENPYVYAPPLDIPSTVLQHYMMSEQVKDQLVAAGATGEYTLASGGGSLAPYTESVGADSLIRFQATSPDQQMAIRTRDAVLSAITSGLAAMQQRTGAPRSQWILTTVIAKPDSAVWIPGSQKRAYLTVFVLLVFMTRVVAKNRRIRDGFRTQVIEPLTGSIPIIRRSRDPGVLGAKASQGPTGPQRA